MLTRHIFHCFSSGDFCIMFVRKKNGSFHTQSLSLTQVSNVSIHISTDLTFETAYFTFLLSLCPSVLIKEAGPCTSITYILFPTPKHPILSGGGKEERWG